MNEELKIKARIEARKIPIPKGKLCEDCNKVLAVDRHHEDYSKPLDVDFVCRSCHIKLDGRLEKNLGKGILFSKNRKGKTNKEVYGDTKAKTISKKIRGLKLGKKLSEEHKAKLRKRKNPTLAERNTKNKGKTYEEIYGIKKAKIIKSKMKKSTKKQSRNKLGKFGIKGGE